MNADERDGDADAVSIRSFTMGLVFLLLFTVPVIGMSGMLDYPLQAADRAFNAADYDTARDHYEQALRIATQEGQPWQVCELMNDLAAVAMAQRQDRGFRQWMNQARACVARLPEVARAADPDNLLQNGSFEQGLAPPWGTGHYEDQAGKTAFGLWWNSLNAQAYMKIDTDIRHSGERALRVTNASRHAPHVFTTTSQRITGLRPNTVYRVSLWAKAQNLAPGAVSFAVDAAWVKRLLSLPPGTYDWQPFSATVNLGHSHYIDLRLIHQNTGTVWLDDLVVVEETGEPSDFGGLLQRAESLRDNAHLAEALALYQRLSHAQPDHLLARYGAGRVRLTLGRYPEALEDFQWLADRKFREAPLALGDVYQQLGEFERARDYYQQALKAVEGDQGTYSLVLDRLAANALSRGDVREAQRAQQHALRILRHIDDKHGQAVALHTLGGINVRLGDQTAAEQSFREALRIARRIEDQRLIADVLVGLADLEIQRGARHPAGRDLEEALAIQKTIGDARGQIAALHLRARLRRQAGARPAALEDWRAATVLLTDLYTRLGSIPQKTRAAFLGQFDALYRNYLDLLLELYQERPHPGLLEEALQTGEKARSRRFTEMMNEARAAAILGESGEPAFTARLRKEREAQLALEALLQRRALLEQMPAGPHNVTRMAELAAEQRRVEAVLRQATTDLARTYPRYEDLRHPQPLRVAELQTLLDSDEALLAYFVTAGHTGILALTPQQVRLVVLSIGREELLARTAEIREAMPAVAEAIANAAAVGAEGIMTAMNRYDPAEAYRLYQLLVAPVAEILDPARRVYLAPDDRLYRLPFETLLTQSPDADSQAPDLATMAYWVRRQALSYLT